MSASGWPSCGDNEVNMNRVSKVIVFSMNRTFLHKQTWGSCNPVFFFVGIYAIKKNSFFFKIQIEPSNLSSTVDGVEGPRLVQALPIYLDCCSMVRGFPTWQLHDWLTFEKLQLGAFLLASNDFRMVMHTCG